MSCSRRSALLVIGASWLVASAGTARAACPADIDALIARLDKEGTDADETVESLRSRGHLGLDCLVTALEKPALAPRRQAAYIDAFLKIYGPDDVEMGPRSVPVLNRALETSPWFVQWRAAKALGLIGSDAAPAVPALAKALEAPDPQDRAGLVRRDALDALRSINTPDALRVWGEHRNAKGPR